MLSLAGIIPCTSTHSGSNGRKTVLQRRTCAAMVDN